MAPTLSGPLGLGRAADTMVGGGYLTKGAGHEGMSIIYVEINTISLGRPHYSSSPPSSTTSYSLKHLCNPPHLLLHHHHAKRHQCQVPHLAPLPHVNCCLCCDGGHNGVPPSRRPSPPLPSIVITVMPSIAAIVFLAALIPRSPVGCFTATSTSRNILPLVRFCPPCCHLLVLFFICGLFSHPRPSRTSEAPS